MKTSRYCFINGQTMPFDKACIKVNDLGLLRSYAVFDYLRTYNGKPFRFPDHYARFKSSAKTLLLNLKYSEKELFYIVNDLLKKSHIEEAAFRFVLTGGYSPDAMTISEPNLIIIVEELPAFNTDVYEKGVKLMTFEFQRDLPQAKTTDYLTAVKLVALKHRKNAYDILYISKGKVLELTRSNFFIFSGDTLITSKDDVLLGVTRKTVLEIAKKYFKTEERIVHTSELLTADEAFLCGTSKKVLPVVQLDDNKVGNGKPGKNTKKLMGLFEELVKHY